MFSSLTVAHNSAQIFQLRCVFFPKTETGVPQFTPTNILCHFSNKGRLLHVECTCAHCEGALGYRRIHQVYSLAV